MFFATTAGCPPVSITLVVSPPNDRWSASHPAARRRSAACSGLVLTLGMDRNSVSADTLWCRRDSIVWSTRSSMKQPRGEIRLLSLPVRGAFLELRGAVPFSIARAADVLGSSSRTGRNFFVSSHDSGTNFPNATATNSPSALRMSHSASTTLDRIRVGLAVTWNVSPTPAQALEPDGHFTRQARPPGRPDRRPDHRLVGDRRQDAAVDDAGEAHRLRGAGQSGVDGAGVGVDVQAHVQAVRVRVAADQAPFGVGEFERRHSRDIIRGRRTVRHRLTSTGWVPPKKSIDAKTQAGGGVDNKRTGHQPVGPTALE